MNEDTSMTLTIKFDIGTTLSGNVTRTVGVLTTEHPASSYGIPVLVTVSGAAYGPSDGNEITTAGRQVYGFAKQHDLSTDEYELCRKFLASNPQDSYHQLPRTVNASDETKNRR